MKHKDSLTAYEWHAELGACAARCRATKDCTTFVAALGSGGAYVHTSPLHHNICIYLCIYLYIFFVCRCM